VKIRALGCPQCGAPVTVTQAQCRFCRAPVRARVELELTADARRTSVDFTTGATPHELTPGKYPEVKVQEGVGLSFLLGAGQSIHLPSRTPFKDGSVRVEGVALGPDAGLAVGLRVTDAGDARLGYVLEARPALGEISVSRFARLRGALVGAEPILPWTKTRALRPVGEINRIELLAADSLIQVRVNDALVARLDDARFGYGVPLYGAQSHGQPGTTTLRRFEYGLL
jgi:hypothetical protein